MREIVDIKSLSVSEISALMHDLSQPKFREKQLIEWLYGKHASTFDQMSNLPASLRDKLSRNYQLNTACAVANQTSSDGTRKYLVEFADGTQVETVGIPSHDMSRLTVCFSTQAGCAMGCLFCATGQSGLSRNLTLGEMYDQVVLVGEDFGMRVSNVVAMGQGEPFVNYEQVLNALRMMNSPSCLNIGARRISVSTCGIIPGIDQFASEPEQFTLAVSLHSALQATRDYLMPCLKAFPLAGLRAALFNYTTTTNRRVTLEYALIKDVNDTKEHLIALQEFCSGLLCHINLIPLNATSDSSPLESSNKIFDFRHALSDFGIETSIRKSRGTDIDGACGQLKQRFKLEH